MLIKQIISIKKYISNGWHLFILGYLSISSSVWKLNEKTKLEFSFRTDLASGILFFGFGGEGIYYYVGLIHNSLYFEFSNGIAIGSVTFQRPDLLLCDGNWYRVVLKKEGQMASIEVVGHGTETSGNSSHSLKVSTSGEQYIGGIPEMSDARKFITRHNLNLPVDGLYEDKISF